MKRVYHSGGDIVEGLGPAGSQVENARLAGVIQEPEVHRDHRLAVVTDGLGRMQRRKVEALDLERRVPEVLFCWEHEAPKPETACYIEALRRLGATPEDAVVIGDNPEHDMAAAKAIGARSIRVMTGRFARRGDAGFAPDATAARFPDVPGILRTQFGAAA